jgi:hypothetical protein
MLEAAHFAVHVPEHRVIGVTGKAGMIFGDTVVLKVGGGKIAGIIDQKTFPVGLHYMARQTKFRRGRLLQMN